MICLIYTGELRYLDIGAKYNNYLVDNDLVQYVIGHFVTNTRIEDRPYFLAHNATIAKHNYVLDDTIASFREAFEYFITEFHGIKYLDQFNINDENKFELANNLNINNPKCNFIVAFFDSLRKALKTDAEWFCWTSAEKVFDVASARTFFNYLKTLKYDKPTCYVPAYYENEMGRTIDDRCIVFNRDALRIMLEHYENPTINKNIYVENIEQTVYGIIKLFDIDIIEQPNDKKCWLYKYAPTMNILNFDQLNHNDETLAKLFNEWIRIKLELSEQHKTCLDSKRLTYSSKKIVIIN